MSKPAGNREPNDLVNNMSLVHCPPRGKDEDRDLIFSSCARDPAVELSDSDWTLGLDVTRSNQL